MFDPRADYEPWRIDYSNGDVQWFLVKRFKSFLYDYRVFRSRNWLVLLSIGEHFETVEVTSPEHMVSVARSAHYDELDNGPTEGHDNYMAWLQVQKIAGDVWGE